ncbi:Na+/H+ antiporter NhaA [Novosphingobium sp. FKTRR1]|uniref:Na+/H+ antiporter NhaA n=1 Tax=Novosphingobium sp. FKTRR1 TaxID=2879118 RepID=UPI001CF0D40D|nr:Na+/H+ antiporter NhaA [Novosphingobium sp. FKTRR1]
MAVFRRISAALGQLLHDEAAPGIVLIVAAIVALALANSPTAHGWHALLHDPLPWTPVTRLASLHEWINDALMALFFFVIGLEIKREILSGELADASRRRLPVIAAVVAMAVPAAVFLGVVHNDAALHQGWAIPAATDIAFALGVLALFGRGLPPSIRLFLLTVAIVDDLGAIAIIAFFYTHDIDLGWLGAAAAILAVLVAINRFGVREWWVWPIPSALLWYATLQSGVHATVAGVLAALTVPLALDRRGDSALLRMEHAMVPFNGFLIVPLFGLANAGVELGDIGHDAMFAPLPIGVALGLLLGKPVGILLAVFGCEWSGIAQRPAGARTLHLIGMALLCGIGFTMSLFLAGLAFPTAPLLVEEAKLGILGGSIVAALLGGALLRLAARQQPAETQ